MHERSAVFGGLEQRHAVVVGLETPLEQRVGIEEQVVRRDGRSHVGAQGLHHLHGPDRRDVLDHRAKLGKRLGDLLEDREGVELSLKPEALGPFEVTQVDQPALLHGRQECEVFLAEQVSHTPAAVGADTAEEGLAGLATSGGEGADHLWGGLLGDVQAADRIEARTQRLDHLAVRENVLGSYAWCPLLRIAVHPGVAVDPPVGHVQRTCEHAGGETEDARQALVPAEVDVHVVRSSNRERGAHLLSCCWNVLALLARGPVVGGVDDLRDLPGAQECG